MRFSKYIALAASLLLVVSCFLPWIFIESRQLTVTGMNTSGTNYGKPAYFHLLLAALFVFCTLVQRVWAKRFNLLVTALNLAWALRNFFVISTCMGGDCPVKKAGLFGVVVASLVMLVSALLPDMKLPETKRN